MEVLPARGPDPGGGHASCGGAHLASADVCVLSLCLTMFTVEKSRLLAPESFLLTGSRGSVSDLLLLVLFVRLNLSSLSAWLPVSVSSNLVSTGFFVSSSVSGILTISAVCSRGLNSLNEFLDLLSCQNNISNSPPDPGCAVVVLLVVEVADGVVEAADDLVRGEAAHSPLQPRGPASHADKVWPR